MNEQVGNEKASGCGYDKSGRSEGVGSMIIGGVTEIWYQTQRKRKNSIMINAPSLGHDFVRRFGRANQKGIPVH